ncbi:alpha/beta hydrolase [Pseudarthrobacter sp. CC12]|uniref:alpha/beta fold hydrolase n=1 Tax=Pseudarthrobacter sp. CC12 TaxID=3029193 RepID=UPI003263EAAE
MSDQYLRGFKHELTDIGNGIRIHSLSGGTGRPLFLLHGFPQTWYQWRHVMPRLAEHHTVVAVDLKGAGNSDKPLNGYDKVNMASELDRLREAMNFDDVDVIGHDIGGMVAYAWAATKRSAIKKLCVLDMPLPGAQLWSSIFSNPDLFHFSFHMRRDIPEMLISGREYLYLESFIRDRTFNHGAFTSYDIDVYAKSFSQPGAMRASFEWYRALPQDVADNERLKAKKLTIPVLALGGDKRWGPLIVEMMSEFSAHVVGGSIPDCNHWIPEEQPDAFVDRIEIFLEDAK